MKYQKRITALLVAGMMLLSALPLEALEVKASNAGGLCEHHSRHTGECGYTEEIKGAPCNHEHVDECYQLVEKCLHEHTEDCCPKVSEDALEHLTDTDVEETGCTHVCSVENGCIAQELNCRHQHDENCGYTEEMPGASCTYKCEICSPKEGEEPQTDWPESPDLPDGPPQLEDGQTTGAIYGQPMQKISAQNLALMQSQSQSAAAVLDENLRIPENQLNNMTFIYVNGTPYGGGNLTVTEGDNFSYMHTWTPDPEEITASGKQWKDGSWFQYELFKVPGLNLAKKIESSLLINGIRVGTFTLTYDAKTGSMTYRVVFNRYIQFFDPKTVLALFQGSGKFSDTNADGNIVNGDKTGSLTIDPRPDLPEIPAGPGGGTGWSPSKAPTFNNNIYAFGKGVKWSSKDDVGAHPQIEWRVVFLEQLQKTQQAFLNGTELTSSEGNLIIEEKLDANQRFYYPIKEAGRGKKYDNNAPFFLELPVIVPGTDSILNGLSNIGNGSYDGPGEVSPVITGARFKEIDGKQAVTPDEIKNVQAEVRNKPLSWTITTDSRTGEQTLLINVGKLGTINSTEGITWDLADTSEWHEKGIQKKIDECDAKIQAIQTGTDSPITLLRNRQNTLLNTLERAVAKQGDTTKAEEEIKRWREDFVAWNSDQQVGPLFQLEDQKGNLIRPLPQTDLAKGFADWKVNDQRKLGETDEYKNYMKSLENLQADQKTYLTNRTKYGDDWKAAKAHYEKTKEFYREGRVYGFVIKLRTESVNTSAGSYKNSVKIELDKNKWSADDNASVQFSSGIMGDFSLGDAVVQKADAFYDTDAADAEDIQRVEKQKAGLEGAEFRVYCGGDGTKPPDITESNLAHFLDKDASERENTYFYTHIGNDSSHTGFQGEITELKVNPDGRLILGRIPPDFNPWLVEIKAPDGYYLDQTPVKIGSENGKVSYKLLPNISRSVLLKKIDSYSRNPVEGAEFQIFKKDMNHAETPVTGFTTKTLNGHKTIWKTKDDSGNTVLKTNADGELCIHGLDAGTYVLRESKPAPGYEQPQKMPEFTFTLSVELPAKTANGEYADGQTYDENLHLLLNGGSALMNDPGVASLTVQKQNVAKEPLGGAGFALFRFIGTEAEWTKNPDDESKWEAVTLSKEAANGKYFKTANEIKDVTLTGEGSWSGKTLGAAFTSEIDPANPDAGGKLTIADIPLGHYSIAEVQAPNGYNRDERSFYFTVDEKAVEEKKIQLYLEPKGNKELKGNSVTNYKRQVQLALVKYDAAGDKPKLEGSPIEEGREGWMYTEKIVKDNAHKGLPNAVYKLFMRRGGSSGEVNPDEKELKSINLQAPVRGYDTCLAVGETDKNGVLRLRDMRTRTDAKINGLNPENYYMIEVKAPEGYLLDQTPIHFNLDEKVFPDDENATAGLVMIASNRKAGYGLRLQKVDAETAGEGKTPTGLFGAEFTVKQDEKLLYFTGSDGTYQLAKDGIQGAVDKVVTGKDGILTIAGLDAGKSYLFTETKAPQGFSCTDADGNPVTAILTTKKSAQDGALIDGVLYPERIEQVKNERLRGRMTLHKADAEDNKPLMGAEFTLYRTEVTVIPPGDPDYDPDNPHATRSEDIVVEKKETDKNGDITFDNLPWHPYYYVIETKAPDGYLLDQTKRQFSIDENSFHANGNSIPVLFPLVSNSKGNLSEAVLYKADEENHDVKLSDAHFYLMKKVGQDADGKEIWTGYGQGMYITDAEGEIKFILPPGQYKLLEMKAPDGYILEAMRELTFSIPETPGDKPLVIDEPGSSDGVVTNRKGDSGVRIRKTLGLSDAPVTGVTFQIGWEVIRIKGIETTYEPMSFLNRGGGNYEYTENPQAPGATTRLVTNKDGLIYVMMPENLKYADSSAIASLYYQEIEAPAGLEQKNQPKNFTLTDGIYTEVNVSNNLKPEEEKKLSITINKTDGKSRLGLPGAEFSLYWYDGTGENMSSSHIEIGKGTTDKDGKLIFDHITASGFPGLMAGETYHIVETKAPEGYILDETHYEVTLDAGHFDENFQFTGAVLELHNYQIKGSVRLKKVDAEDRNKGLSGAEFELLRKENAFGNWEHYGKWRYITDENGELYIENLPYGSYQLVERAAPLGYLLDDPVFTETFQIEMDGQQVKLDPISNKEDPAPRRDVSVKKVAAENTDLILSGAQFQLYQMAQDGKYYLRQDKIYETDAGGSFIIRDLPIGNYALREIKAPEGYEISKQDMTYFAVSVTDRIVSLQIENIRTESGGALETPVTVQKIWKDHSSAQRPERILVQLYRNGIACGRPVELNQDNGWKYQWDDLDKDIRWTVDEIEVPEGYEKSVTNQEYHWTITNTAKDGVFTEADQSEKPGYTADSTNHVLETGDSAQTGMWIILAVIAAAGFLYLLRKAVLRKKKK